jgi:hypothetical protein
MIVFSLVLLGAARASLESRRSSFQMEESNSAERNWNEGGDGHATKKKQQLSVESLSRVDPGVDEEPVPTDAAAKENIFQEFFNPQKGHNPGKPMARKSVKELEPDRCQEDETVPRTSILEEHVENADAKLEMPDTFGGNDVLFTPNCYQEKRPEAQLKRSKNPLGAYRQSKRGWMNPWYGCFAASVMLCILLTYGRTIVTDQLGTHLTDAAIPVTLGNLSPREKASPRSSHSGVSTEDRGYILMSVPTEQAHIPFPRNSLPSRSAVLEFSKGLPPFKTISNLKPEESIESAGDNDELASNTLKMPTRDTNIDMFFLGALREVLRQLADFLKTGFADILSVDRKSTNIRLGFGAGAVLLLFARFYLHRPGPSRKSYITLPRKKTPAPKCQRVPSIIRNSLFSPAKRDTSVSELEVTADDSARMQVGKIDKGQINPIDRGMAREIGMDTKNMDLSVALLLVTQRLTSPGSKINMMELLVYEIATNSFAENDVAPARNYLLSCVDGDGDPLAKAAMTKDLQAGEVLVDTTFDQLAHLDISSIPVNTPSDDRVKLSSPISNDERHAPRSLFHQKSKLLAHGAFASRLRSDSAGQQSGIQVDRLSPRDYSMEALAMSPAAKLRVPRDAKSFTGSNDFSQQNPSSYYNNSSFVGGERSFLGESVSRRRKRIGLRN